MAEISANQSTSRPRTSQKKNEEIAEFLKQVKPEIKANTLVVYAIDECHLLWGDILGYVWGSTKQRVKVSIDNQKERQTYYGALNLNTQEFIVKEYETANRKNTVKFIEEIISRHPQQKILLIWDGASYHRGEEMQQFLQQVNSNKSAPNWSITCCLFAPYAPEENPVEAIWLQVKNFLRKFYYLGKKFKLVRRLFQLFFKYHLFNFPNLNKYDAFSQLI